MKSLHLSEEQENPGQYRDSPPYKTKKGKTMKILDTKKIYDSGFLHLFVRKFETSKGKIGSWFFASRHSELPDKPKSNAVIIVSIWTPKNASNPEEYRVVLKKEFRIPINDYEYGFPAGLIDKGETVESTARRELKEETGLDLKTILEISPTLCSSAGMTDEAFNYVFAYCEGELNTSGLEEHEDIEPLLLNMRELGELLLKKDVNFCAKTWPMLRDFVFREEFVPF